jgi:phosphatidylserine synthase
MLADPVFRGIAMFVMAALSFAMVTSLPYRSFKDLDLKHRVPFIFVLGLVLVFVLISFDPPLVVFIIFLAYALSGPVEWALLRKKGINAFKPLNREVENAGTGNDPASNGEATDGRD